MMVKKNCSI